MLSIMDPVDIDGLTVYRDDEDPRKFYLLPDQPVISTDGNGVPDFYFIQYRGVDAGHKEGGYVQFRTVLTIDAARRGKVIAALKDILTQDQASGHKPFGLAIGSTDPVLADPLWTKGTVSVLTMQAAPDGLVTVSPDQPLPCDLAGALGASGRLSLSPDGASVFWAAFSDYQTQKLPILITYQLTYRARVSATLTIDAEGSTVIKQLWERAQPAPYVFDPGRKRFIRQPVQGTFDRPALAAMKRKVPGTVAMVEPQNVARAVHSCVTDKTITVVINTDSGGSDAGSAKVQEALFKLATDLLTNDIIPAIFGTGQGQGQTAPQPQPGSDATTDPAATKQLLQLPGDDTSTLHFHINMTSNSVIDRNVNPSSALQVLISDPRVLETCFKQITLGNDFFSKKHVVVSTAGINFAADGISAIAVSGRYTATDEIGHQPPAGALHPDVVLKSETDTGHWDFALSRDAAGVPRNRFEYTTKVYYSNVVLATDWQPWEADALTVNPAAMGAVRVQLVLTARREEIRSVSVALGYRKASGEVLSDVVILTPDDARKTWIKTTGEIRPPGAPPLAYTYQLTYQTIAAGQITLAPQTVVLDTLEVPTPFPRTLSFLFTPQGSFTDVAAITGDVTYEDAAHGYKLVKTFSLDKLSAAYAMDVPILDGGPQEVTWVARIVRSDGSQIPLPPGRGGIGNHPVGLVQFPPFKITVVPDLVDFDKDVQLVAVKLTYHDPVNGDLAQELRFSKSTALQQTWSVPQYAADSPRRYDIDVRYFAYDRSKTSEQHQKDVEDATFYLDRSVAAPA
jgi:hypothetical protein